jgi:phenylalanyl-tRNA synthetase alpha chain
MQSAVAEIERAALAALAGAADEEAIRAVTVRFLGRKGELTQLLRSLAALPADERPAAGQRANQARQRLENAVAEAEARVRHALLQREAGIDVSLPGRRPIYGAGHPITQVTDEICAIFMALGFDIAEGPEVETDHYNFEALNIPADHPARDMQDTFYVSEAIVLRTHTSPIQVRTMESRRPPVRIIAPGKVYRCDSDITHTPMFHQVEGLLVDERVSFGDLKGILTAFVQRMFDARTALRFRPSFFPFTEPSAEVDILCVMCRGEGCRVCKGSGWLEVLGSGMVHPAVFENVGYDPRQVTGFAFGMGVERIAMLKYGIDDIRKFFENDLRFLRQFTL